MTTKPSIISIDVFDEGEIDLASMLDTLGVDHISKVKVHVSLDESGCYYSGDTPTIKIVAERR